MYTTHPYHTATKKLQVGILGSGNIGTDLLLKIQRSPFLECCLFVGKNLASPGMIKASELGISISDQSISAFTEATGCELVFDATTAAYHPMHANVLKHLGIKVIDMTPSQIGSLCIPALNQQEALSAANINMITCGGQAAIPIAHVLKKEVPEIEYIEVVSVISSKSAGPGTRANIDAYIHNTEIGLKKFTGCSHVKAILNLNPATPCVDMQTTIFAKVDQCNIHRLRPAIQAMIQKIKSYVPGYHLVFDPIFENGKIMVMIKVKGQGDYLPSYAGNLDIINCAAIAMAEEYSKIKCQ